MDCGQFVREPRPVLRLEFGTARIPAIAHPGRREQQSGRGIAGDNYRSLAVPSKVTAIEWFARDRLTRVVRAVVCIEFAVAVTALVALGVHLFQDVFAGPPRALPVHFDASCEGPAPASPCKAAVTELNPGRYRIVTDAPAVRLNLKLAPDTAVTPARALLTRLEQPGVARLAFQTVDSAAQSTTVVHLKASGVRSVTAMPAAPRIASLSFLVAPGAEPVPFVLDEIGFFSDDRGLLNDVRPVFPWIPAVRFYGALAPRAIVRLVVFCVMASFALPGGRLRRMNPVLVGLVCFSFCLFELAVLFSPYGAHDLRLFYASGALQQPSGSNLNVSLWQGFRLLHGEGLTYARGAVPWERMPGYGLFCAFAGLLFGADTILDLAMAVVRLQVLFYAAAVACFAWAAGRLWPPQAVFTLGVLIAYLPKQLGYTQVDALIAPIALLVMASLCLRINAVREGRPVRWSIDGLVHLAFALWFAPRLDALPGWLIVSLALHRREWRRLLVPATLFIAIGCSWGVYKLRYTHEFAMTTSSAGASLFCGLWEVPSRFALTCSDSSYFEWVRRHTSFDPRSKRANDFAIREVVRFWVTFPGHLAIMIDDKLMQCLGGRCWPGFRTSLHEALFYLLAWPPRMIAGLLTIIGLCLAVGHERGRTLLLAWPVFLDAPMFWIMFESEGRFYGAIPIALLVAAVPPLFEGEFYRRLTSRPRCALSVLAGAGVLAVSAWPLHDWLMRADALHYWTPFLDPSKSALSGFK